MPKKAKNAKVYSHLKHPRSLDDAFNILLGVVHQQAAARGINPRRVAREVVRTPYPDSRLSDLLDIKLTPDCEEYRELRAWFAELLYEGSRNDIARAKKFTDGRKPGSVGSLKKFVIKKIEAARKKGTPASEITPASLWQNFLQKPSRGFDFNGEPREKNCNVWVVAEDKHTEYKRFENIVGEVKRTLGINRKRKRISE